MNDKAPPRDYRRMVMLVMSILLLAGAAALHLRGENEGSGKFAVGAMGRIGLVLGGLWLAWPSLQRPAQWLPPGIAVAAVIAMMVLAAQPRLIVVAAPALGTLFAISMFVRGTRGRK